MSDAPWFDEFVVFLVFLLKEMLMDHDKLTFMSSNDFDKNGSTFWPYGALRWQKGQMGKVYGPVE